MPLYLRLLAISLLFITFLTPFTAIAESTTDYLQKSQQAQQQGEFKTALIELKNAAKKYPDDIHIRIALADLYIKIGQGPHAEIELSKAEFSGAAKSDTQLLKIKSQLIQGKFSEVTSQIDQILAVDTKDIARIRALQGQAYLNQNNINKARSYFLRASRLAPDELEVKVGLARLYSLDGKNKKAGELIKKLLQQHPYNVDVLLLAGNLYRTQKKYKEAIEIFRAATEIQPGNTAVWLGIVTSLIGNRQYKEADETIKKILSVDAEHEAANHLQAIIAYQLKDYTKAQQAIKIVEKNNRNHKGILLVSGSVFFQLGKYDIAEQKLSEFLEFQPEDNIARKMLAAIYLKRKQGSQAVKVLEPLEKNKDIEVFSLLSSAYKLMGNTQKSARYLEQALSLAPDNPALVKQERLSQIASGKINDRQLSDDNFDNFSSIGLINILASLKKGDADTAIQLLKSYQLKTPDNPAIESLLAQAYLQKKDYQQARSHYQNVLKLNPDDMQPRISLARLSLQEKDIKAAKREYQRVLTKDPNNEMAMIDLAKLSMDENNPKDMLTWLNKARRANKSSITPRILLNRYYLANNQLDEALKITMELVEIQPESISILKLHADNLLTQKNLSEAIRIYKKIVSLNPDSPLAYYWLASAQYLWQDYKNARNNFIKLLKLKPDHTVARSAVIKIDLRNNKYNEALKQADELVKTAPDVALSYETQGDVLMLLKQPEKALLSYQKGLTIQGKNHLLVNKIARAYALTGNFKQATDTFEKFLKKHSDNIKIHLTLAVLYQQTGQPDKAREHYEKVIKLAPDNVSAINNLALIYAAQGNPKSFEYAEIAYSLAPENAGVLDTLGWLLLENGEPERALILLKQAIQLKPSDFDIRYHYAAALHKNGHTKESRNHLNMIVPVPGKFKARQDAEKLLKSL